MASTTRYVKFIRKGDKGDKGAVMRGPQAWSDCAVGYKFQAGENGDEFKDVVMYNNNYYSCIKSHTKTANNAPGSTEDTNNGYWKLADKFEIIATKILLAQLSFIENLGVDNIIITSQGKGKGDVLLKADKNGIVCNSGTFNNINVNGNILAKSLRLQVVKDNSTIDGAVALAEWNRPIILPELNEGECMNIKIYAPQGTRSSPDAEVNPQNSNVKIWVSGTTTIAASKNVGLGYGLFDAVGIGYSGETIWAIK